MIRLTDHAILRYQERVKPCLDYAAARAEAVALVRDFAVIQTEPPAWHTTKEPFTAYAVVTEAIAFGLNGRDAVTCLTRGGMGESAREARNKRRRNRRGVAKVKAQSWRDAEMTKRDRAGRPRRKDWDAAA